MSDERRSRILGLLRPGGRGLEIGPLHQPIATKDRHDVWYVDVFSGPELRRKYADDPNVETESIVDVDFATGGSSLGAAVKEQAPFDWVIASHVVEHAPDLVGWLGEIAEVLVDGGQLVLAVPDQRYTFDVFRQLTTTGQVIEARGRTVPSVGAVYDHYRGHTEVTAIDLWAGLRPDRRCRTFPLETVLDQCRRAQQGEYVDAHVWVFTPESFLEQMAELCALELCDFTVEYAGDTLSNDCEFFVVLRKD